MIRRCHMSTALSTLAVWARYALHLEVPTRITLDFSLVVGKVVMYESRVDRHESGLGGDNEGIGVGAGESNEELSIIGIAVETICGRHFWTILGK